MTRSDMVKRLVKEGLTTKTLVNFNDRQLKDLCERMLGEAAIPLPAKQSWRIDGIGDLPGSPKGYTISQNPTDKTITAVKKESEMKEEKKKPTEKQLSALDKNKNKKIDKQDFELLRKGKKSEVKESEKWIQKAIDPSKKGSLKKALGVKKDEKIPAEKLKSASKKGGKLGQRARLAMTLKKLKEHSETKNWVEKLVENNYHPVTTKNEIMEIIKIKLHEQPQPGIAEPEVLPDVDDPRVEPDDDPFSDPFDEPGPVGDPQPKMKKRGDDLPDFLKSYNILGL
jgi:hypothetical protein